MVETEIVNFLVNNSFAVFVAVYTLTRLERNIKENTIVLQELIAHIKK